MSPYREWNQKQKHKKQNQRDGSFGLWFVSDALTHCCLRQNRSKEPSLWFVVYFQCVDTLAFAPKHAEGMSLRYDALFPLLL